MKIPKYIHYCWFGNGELPKKYQKYIMGWKKYHPDFEIICWNETNFPINEFKYARQAFANGKYAFVSDVARMYALNTMGGIYFDTDVEIIRPINELLYDKEVILGTESVEAGSIGTGFMAFIKDHEITRHFLEYYKNTDFINNDGKFNMKPNTAIMAEVLRNKYNIYPSNDIQIKDDMIVYPQEYFTAFNGFTGVNETNKNTYCIHHFTASWQSNTEKIKSWLRKRRNRMIVKIENIKNGGKS